MLAAYLFASIVGWVLLGASLAGGHGSGDAHAGGPETAIEHAGYGAAHAMLVSLRFWTYVLAFGGTTGVLLRWTAKTGEPLTVLTSAGVGVVCGAAAQLVWSRLSNMQGGTVRHDQLVGHTGRLLLPASPTEKGRVRLTVGNASIDLIAQCDELSLPAQEEVLVVSVREGIAHVVKNPARR